MRKPHYPIVYVRGYAMSQNAVEDTVADPYMGFNVGSTKIRQLVTRDVVRHIFESPLVRLMKDEEYSDIYEDGSEMLSGKRPSERAVWIYRYYEPVSKSLGTGERPEIEDYARGLKDLIDLMERRYCTRNDRLDPELQNKFRVYLVAHSMGGLICRCLLQNISPGDKRVDKVFTYATPHGGIDLRVIGNVPEFLQYNNTENFSEKRMRKYLELPDSSVPVHSLGGKFPPERFFSLIGTNHRDYNLAKWAVGPMSDGLVQIKNAYAAGTPRAFVHRAHSGHYGIVNSEEGYQNLRRFFFGDVRIHAYLDIAEITLPEKVQRKKDDGKTVRASYYVETIARVRGKRWDLHRRLVDEASALFVDYDAHVRDGEPVHLASIFLSMGARVTPQRRTLGFSLDLRVQVPEYRVDGGWFNSDHYEGGYLYRDKVNLEAGKDRDGEWRLKYGFDSVTPNLTSAVAASAKDDDDSYTFAIPIQQASKPGIQAVLRLVSTPWNRD
mgnify:CR=1 FL=1